MVPADEECHAAVLKYLTSTAVRDRFEKLKQMAAPEVFEKLPKGLQQYVQNGQQQVEGFTNGGRCAGRKEPGKV